MVQGEAQDTAAARLKYLNDYLLEHPVTGPEGHSYTRFAGRTGATASVPFSLGTLSHVQASVREVVELTHTVNPDAGPAPSRADAVYDWCRENTAHAPEADRQRAESVEYRQYLEHAIRAGDYKVVRRHRCPECRCLGLMWDRNDQQARCTNANCVDRNGFSRTVSLSRLATEHVAARKEIRRARAT